MEEEDDDLYGPSETTAPSAAKTEDAKNAGDASSGDEPMDEGLESGEEDESDSDSDIEIIIDKPAVAPKPVQSTPQESKAIKIEAPPQQTAAQTQAPKTTPLHLPTGQPGTAYPAVRTSTIEVNADPVYPPLGKPISQVDIDADLAEATKPWRLPGADQSDYFNYGFDEFTWEMYRQRQATVASNLAQQKAETAQLQQFFGSMGGPGAANAGAAPPATPAGPATGAGGPGNMPMPGGMNEEMMAQAFQQMMAQGIDPSNMDFGAFMSMAGGGMPGFGGPAGPQGGFGGGGGGGGNQGGGGGGGGGRRGGRGRGNW
ncbi:hypothetical protein K458DRAFT_447126 [Lentithecium fluviatile CBS 122367]|uniref:Pre-mRNA polyadenylation factor Fip1 domain-containing protein n=1 Tax=Lentithecium fluviatile CBS 122367 TaxID=1168545 RepID=A0A6G1IGH5_9PLEO|nr:hypothetical protein K458DRAFT_447126 [Lentithecium fluviatile CBS 122367]